MKAWLKGIGKALADRADDFLAALGLAVAVKGIYMIYPPAAFVIGGAAILVIALLRAGRQAGS